MMLRNGNDGILHVVVAGGMMLRNGNDDILHVAAVPR